MTKSEARFQTQYEVEPGIWEDGRYDFSDEDAAIAFCTKEWISPDRKRVIKIVRKSTVVWTAAE